LPISDGRRDRKNFDVEPAKHVPGHVPELEKRVGSGVSRVEESTLKERCLVKL